MCKWLKLILSMLFVVLVLGGCGQPQNGSAFSMKMTENVIIY